MESLTDVKCEQARDAESKSAIERVKFGKLEAAKVAALAKQIEEASGGFLQLSRAEIVNFLIRERRDELTTKELIQIRSDHYDPVRHLNWITPRLKEALLSRDTDQISRLQNELRGIELSAITCTAPLETGAADDGLRPKKLRQKRKSSGFVSDSKSLEPSVDAVSMPSDP